MYRLLLNPYAARCLQPSSQLCHCCKRTESANWFHFIPVRRPFSGHPTSNYVALAAPSIVPLPQGVLATLGSNVVLGKLVDDTLHDYSSTSSTSRGNTATVAAAAAASGGGASAASRSSSFRGSAACSAGGASICEMPSFRYSASGTAIDASHGGGGGPAADATAAAAAPATSVTSVLTKQSSFAGFSPAGLAAAAAAAAAAGAGASAFAFSSVGSDGALGSGEAAAARRMSAFASVGHHLVDLDEDTALGAAEVLQLGQSDVMRAGQRGDQEEQQQRRLQQQQQQEEEEDEFGSCVDDLVGFPTFRDGEWRASGKWVTVWSTVRCAVG